MEPAQEETIVRPIRSSGGRGRLILILLGILIVLLAGSTTGYLLAWPKDLQPSQVSTTSRVSEEKSQRPKSAQEDAVFADCAEGSLEAIKESDLAKLDGTHKLIPSDPSKIAYLTSSVVDLGKYEGDKVTVWGEPHASNKVGWLMDVGRITSGLGKCQNK